MRISLSPVRSDEALTVEKAGDILTINGEAFDFTSIPDGGEVREVPCNWVVGPVGRVEGAIHITLLLPHGQNPSHAVAFPAAITDAVDGVISLPRDEVADVDA